VSFLIQDEQERFSHLHVSCLFAREVYKREALTECLGSLGTTPWPPTWSLVQPGSKSALEDPHFHGLTRRRRDSKAVHRGDDVKGKVDGDYLRLFKMAMP